MGQYEERIAICKACPLCKEEDSKHICNPDLWMNPETLKTSRFKRKGYVQGCACCIEKKAKQSES